MIECLSSRYPILWDPLDAFRDQISSILDVILGVLRLSIRSHQSLQIHFSVVGIPLEELDDGSFANLAELTHLLLSWHTFD